MTKDNAPSLVRFFFDKDNYWMPTTDFSYLTAYPSPFNNELIFFEELSHRDVFLTTELWSWMSWMEALSNCEFLLLLKKFQEYEQRDRSFSLHIPLEKNLSNAHVPVHLKLMITDILQACRNITLHEKIAGPLLESIVLCLVKDYMPKDQFRIWMRKKTKIYGQIATVFPLMFSLFQSIGENQFANAARCIFTIEKFESFPSLSLGTSFASFNEKTARNVYRRFAKISKLVGNRKLKKEEFIELTKRYGLDFMNNQDIAIRKSKATWMIQPDVEKINNYYFLDGQVNWVERIFAAAWVPFAKSFVSKETIDAMETRCDVDEGLAHFLIKGHSSLSVYREESTSADEDIDIRSMFKYRYDLSMEEFEGMLTSFEATLIKYAYIEGIKGSFFERFRKIFDAKNEESISSNFLEGLRVNCDNKTERPDSTVKI